MESRTKKQVLSINKIGCFKVPCSPLLANMMMNIRRTISVSMTVLEDNTIAYIFIELFAL